MEIYTVKEFQNNWDEYIARVEAGETIGVIDENGKAAVFMPQTDELKELYTNHNDAS